ncbi:hypothetical protein NST83_19395 [Paenibacillus sp. FSL R10-2782]|uniref:Uncharacterized protein n=1 Tax=Paenibacillus terrae TaxID=159743 RepID=A0A4U2Q5N0_9BACL|nr:hypothetical protein [Paenibacillus terrae]TKH46759.1 hypothetical protein C1I60_01015 [Paenibacillus terrae]
MRKQFFGLDFDIQTSIENKEKKLILLPNPEAQLQYQNSLATLDEQSLQLLWSKSFFGINHTTQLFRIMYDTFNSKVNDIKTNDDILTVHALFCDMIIRFGTIIEDFAGFCSACKRHVTEGTNIAEHFLAYSNPNQFYTDMLSKQGAEFIRQIFRIPQSQDDLDTIFTNLSAAEKELLWKGISVTTEIISERMKITAKSIVREQPTNFTLFDLYNKLKHGFAPYYSYIFPIPITLTTTEIETTNEEMVESYLIKFMLIMHNKLKGQMNNIELQKLRVNKLATCATTLIEATKETADEILQTVIEIDYLYKYLVKRYITYASGSKRILLLGSKDHLTIEESNDIETIISNDKRYT